MKKVLLFLFRIPPVNYIFSSNQISRTIAWAEVWSVDWPCGRVWFPMYSLAS